MLSYCFREVIRNVFEHANCGECSVMAQSWSNNIAEVAIIDRGVGIKKSLSSTYNIVTHVDALKLAVKPGISSGSVLSTGGKWGNEGYGLYILSLLSG